MSNEISDSMKLKMDKVIEDLKRNFSKIRTGRASLALVDDVVVDFYGVENHINQLATLTIPESKTIMIAPWDTSALQAIEKAILKSDLGITPSNDGKVIRLTMPALTEERRKDMVKQIKKIAEDHKIAVRSLRHKGNDEVKQALKDKLISEDESHKHLKDNQEVTGDFEKKINEIEQHKEKEVMEI